MNKFSGGNSISIQVLPIELQQEVKLLRNELQQIQEQWPDIIKLNPTENNSPSVTIYDIYPYLFVNAFPQLTYEDIRPLSIAARLLASAIFLGDKLMDDENSHERTVSMILNIHALQMEAFHILNRLFPMNPSFWQRLKKYTAQYIEASLIEQSFINNQRQWSEYDVSLAAKLASGKSGIACAVLAGMVALAENETYLENLLLSMNYYNIANQMLDDISDWREDLLAGRPSLVTTLIFKEKPKLQSGLSQDEWMESTARKIYYGGISSSVMQVALKSLEKAEEAVAHAPNMLWHKTLKTLHHHILITLNDTNEMIQRNMNGMQKSTD